MDVNELKRQAAWRAVEFVEDGMVVGLGHGSTAACAVDRVAELLRTGELSHIVCVPCSEEVAGVLSAITSPPSLTNRRMASASALLMPLL